MKKQGIFPKKQLIVLARIFFIQKNRLFMRRFCVVYRPKTNFAKEASIK